MSNTEQHLAARSIIVASLNTETYNRIKNHIPEDIFRAAHKAVFRVVGEAQELFGRDLTLEEVKALHEAKNPAMSKDQKNNLDKIYDTLEDTDVYGPDVAEELLRIAYSDVIADKLADVAVKLQSDPGDNENTVEELREVFEEACNILLKNADKGDLSVKTSMKELIEADDPGQVKMINIPKFKDVAPYIPDGMFVVLGARPNSGKCLAKGSKVIMRDGTMQFVEDLKIGDELAHPNGGYQTITNLGNGVADLYRVTLRDGSCFECNGDHILALERSKTEGKKHQQGDKIEVSVKDYINWPDGRKARYKAYRETYSGSPQDLKIPAWVLGFWLGDGTSSKPSVTISDKEPELVEELRNRVEFAWPNLTVTRPREKDIEYSIRGKDGWCHQKSNPNHFLDALRDYDLLNNKHIPEVYFMAPHIDRLRLLEGLIDSDGYYSNGYYEITQKSEALADGIVRLAHSLGMFASIKQVEKSSQNGTKGLYYRVNISPGKNHIEPVLKRKVHTPNPKTKDSRRQSFTITSAGTGEYYGFTLDGDGLFYTEDYIVTHNTSFLATITSGPGGFMDQGYKTLFCLNEESVPRVIRRHLTIRCNTPWDIIKVTYDKDHDETMEELLANNVYADISAGCTLMDVERQIELHEPDVLITDILDKVHQPGVFQREDLKLERIYRSYRDIGKKYNIPVIGCSQVSDEGTGRFVLTADMLKDSRTGKYAEADAIWMIGRGPADPNKADADDPRRCINVAKDKLHAKDGYHRYVQLVDANIGLFSG